MDGCTRHNALSATVGSAGSCGAACGVQAAHRRRGKEMSQRELSVLGAQRTARETSLKIDVCMMNCAGETCAAGES